MSNTPRTDNCIDIANDEGIEDVKFCEVIANLARQLERELAEANRKLAERINDDQRYLVAPLCNAEKALDDCQSELAEARAEIDALRMGKMSPCDYYTSKESEENLCRELFERDKLIEQMRSALQYALTEVRSTHGERLIKTALAAERISKWIENRNKAA